MKRLKMYTLLLLVSTLALASCSDDATDTDDEREDVVDVEDVDPEVTGFFAVASQNTQIEIVEGAGVIDIPVTIVRNSEHELDITMSAATRSATDAANLTSAYTDAVLSGEEDSTTLQLNLDIGSLPIQPQQRTVVVTASDTDGNSAFLDITLQVDPTPLPDIYLLVGQSNMVGSSEFNAKQSDNGQIDATNARIRQLNVTFNDSTNFATEEDFTNPENLFNTGQALTQALDPLHSGLESDNTKSGTQIGMGLSFARNALNNTTATIYLVPAAWSDTGFCSRETNALPGVGWNATQPTDSAFSGTLLHDRAIARANATLELTGGILRGILWHQGEADSDDQVCADSYEDNLLSLISSLRQNIDEDARGPSARQADSDIPFIVGTMSMGDDQLPFSDEKLTVDAAHRNLPNVMEFADFVNADDLVPPSFPCGNGSCIHFGSTALREMGRRYYNQLVSVLSAP